MATTYTHTTFATAKDRLAELLGDSAQNFWGNAELGAYIIEALRWWGLTAQYWRETGKVEVVAGQAFYRVNEDVENLAGTELLQDLDVTDRDIISDALWNLIEPQIPSWPAGWVGTEMFTLGELADSLSKGRDELLKLSGCMAQADSYVITGSQERIDLDEDTVQVLRATCDEDGSDGPLVMWATDYYEIQGQLGLPATGRPKAFVQTYTPVLAMDIFPPARTQSTIEVQAVHSLPQLAPETSAQPIGLPDDACWLAKYRLLEDLLQGDGLAAAPEVAQYCNERWQAGLTALMQYQSILWATVVGKRMTLSSVAQLDAQRPGWQQETGTPKSLHLLNWNTFAVYPVPDADYTLQVEVVRKAPVPSADGDFIQVGREQMSTLYDYATHIAMIKCQGAELQAVAELLASAETQAADYRAKLAAPGVNWIQVERLTGQDRWMRPYRGRTAQQEADEASKEAA